MDTDSALPWQGVRQALEARFPNQKLQILVLDDYQAKYLEKLFPDYTVQGVYAYLSQKAGCTIASALDIYEAFQTTLKKVLDSQSDLPFLEAWEYAKNFSEDIREILLSFSPHHELGAYLEPLLSIWQEVATEKALQDLFALSSEGQQDIPWVQLLQLPRTYQGPIIKLLYERIPEFARDFLNELQKNKQKVLGEELFTKTGSHDRIIFWNVFSPERRIREWMQYQVGEGRAEVWGWDIRPLQECIGDPIWPPAESSVSHTFTPTFSLQEAFSPWEKREIHFRRHFRTRTELLEAAAVEIAKAYQAGTIVGVWVGDATVKPLLEELLRKEGFTGLVLTHPTLSETRIGHFLRRAYQRGFVPSLESLPQWEPYEDAEMTAYHLYYLFRRGGADQAQSLTALMHFLRFLERLPLPGGRPAPSTSFLSGALAQLAGLAYEKLFILLPPEEPLGPWFRPSFLPAPIRRRYYPPTYRTTTAWRLLTLLLYGSRQTYLYQLAGEENQSPLEDFFTSFPQKYPCLSRLWTLYESNVPSYPSTLTRISETEAFPLPWPRGPLSKPPETISPSELYEFLECPRRYYLHRIVRIPESASSVQAFLGTWLHEALSAALIGPSPHPKKSTSSSKTLLLQNFSALEKLWSPRRLYRVLRSTYQLAQRRSMLKLPPLSRNPEMRFWQRLWAESGRLFFEHISQTCPPPAPIHPLRLHPESWVNPSIAPHYESTLKGRIDLLITSQYLPLLALDYKTGAIPKNAGNLADFLNNWQETLKRLSQHYGPDKKMIHSIDFQAFTYTMNFSPDFTLIVANAFNKGNYALYKLSDAERLEVQKWWRESFELLLSRYEALTQVLSEDDEVGKRKKVGALFPMTLEESSCWYCPYKLLCQRL